MSYMFFSNDLFIFFVVYVSNNTRWYRQENFVSIVWICKMAGRCLKELDRSREADDTVHFLLVLQYHLIKFRIAIYLIQTVS